MEFVIQSGNPISYDIIKMIMDILRESHCPHESFRNSVPDYQSFIGRTIQLANGDAYKNYIVLKPRFLESYTE